jgi:hypothetical protein
MGWQSDWLYQLIFHEVERVWRVAVKEGAGRLGPAPTILQVSEMDEADWVHAWCRGVVLRRWTLQGGKPESLTLDQQGDADLGERRGMFYERSAASFCIDSDRKRVLFTYTLGPRYGRGMVFDVMGQGTKGKLRPNGGPMWVSKRTAEPTAQPNGAAPRPTQLFCIFCGEAGDLDRCAPAISTANNMAR